MFLTGRGTLASCPRQEETRDKRVPVVAAGSGPLAGKLAPEYPQWSGCQSRRIRVPTRVTICCSMGNPFQGPKLGSCLTLGNELSRQIHVLTNSNVLTKQEILLGKGTRVESSSVRKPRRTALPRGSQCTGGVSFKPFPNSSGWWWLISPTFLIRISCHKTTHANGYYGAWPGWGGFNQCASPNNSPCKMGHIAVPLVQAP